MMHFNRPWIHQQQMMMVEQPYYQYTINDLQAYYSSSEHQEEENDHTGDEMPSETSGDQSPHGDMFRLAFAASQWSKLVLNAEGLFNKLMSTNVLPSNEQHLLKNQIEQWLCMKQEYEECIAGDDSGSLQGYTENTRRSLERIEEVTETDEKTDESNNWMKLQTRAKSCSGSESDVYDDEDQSDLESEDPDFLDKLDEYMTKFKNDTDEIIDSKKNHFSKNISPVPKPISNSSFAPIVKPMRVRNQASRRTSILPYSEMSNELAEFQKQNISSSNVQNDHYEHILPSINSSEDLDNQEKCNNNNRSFEEETMAVVKAQSIDVDPEILSTLKMLRINNEEKQTQIKKIQFDLEFARKQCEELQNAITSKEQYIEEILDNCETRNCVKQKLQKKRSKIEEKYRNIEKVLHQKRMYRDTEDDSAYNDEIKKYERSLLYYEKKLKDAKFIKQVAGDSAKTVIYMKDSLSASKKQMEKLKQWLIEEEEQKKTLEEEFLANKKKIKEIEDKYGLKAKKLRELLAESEDERNYYSRLKMKSDDKSLVEADDKEALRQEIQHLRKIRDFFIDAKCSYASDRIYITLEKQRNLLVISEFVETIDALIEQKNVMICGKSIYNENKPSDKMKEHGRKKIALQKLSHDELVILFYNYFYKVVDLKESSKNLELQNATLEETLKQQKIKHDIAMIDLQKFHEQRINALLKFCAEENSSSSYDNGYDRNRDFERLVKENQVLRRRLAHFDSLLKASGTTKAVRSNSIKTTKQVLKPELMQLALPPKTTKVTRQGNKLIFQTSEKEK